jgi:hypothetical protein
MPIPVKSIKDIKVGDFFEDCAFHPCLCTLADSEGDEDAVEGISLVRFDTLAVEYKVEGGWQRVEPQNWPWFSGRAWCPGTSETIPVPRPAEVARDAPWRIEFVCCPEGEADDRHKARMETPEIPPMWRTNE